MGCGRESENKHKQTTKTQQPGSASCCSKASSSLPCEIEEDIAFEKSAKWTTCAFPAITHSLWIDNVQSAQTAREREGEREGERESVCVCVCVSECVSECVSVCVCV